MAPEPSVPAGGSVADSLVAFARHHGIEVTDELSLIDLLTAINPCPWVPHRTVLIAGAVMAFAFRHERLLGTSASSDAGHLTTDRFY